MIDVNEVIIEYIKELDAAGVSAAEYSANGNLLKLRIPLSMDAVDRIEVIDETSGYAYYLGR